jgi:hypothetical protein
MLNTIQNKISEMGEGKKVAVTLGASAGVLATASLTVAGLIALIAFIAQGNIEVVANIVKGVGSGGLVAGAILGLISIFTFIGAERAELMRLIKQK